MKSDLMLQHYRLSFKQQTNCLCVFTKRHRNTEQSLVTDFYRRVLDSIFSLCLPGDSHPDNEDVAALELSRRYSLQTQRSPHSLIVKCLKPLTLPIIQSILILGYSSLYYNDTVKGIVWGRMVICFLAESLMRRLKPPSCLSCNNAAASGRRGKRLARVFKLGAEPG